MRHKQKSALRNIHIFDDRVLSAESVYAQKKRVSAERIGLALEDDGTGWIGMPSMSEETTAIVLSFDCGVYPMKNGTGQILGSRHFLLDDESVHIRSLNGLPHFFRIDSVNIQQFRHQQSRHFSGRVATTSLFSSAMERMIQEGTDRGMSVAKKMY